jgi:hypothetical protein
MTQEEYKSKVNEINNDHQEKLRLLAKEYAYSNNPYSIGDIVTDPVGSIKIEQIKYQKGSIWSSFPSCIYFGIELTKKGEPNKRGNKRSVFQSNIK